MPRLTKEQWDVVRLDYEAGMAIRAMATKYGVDKTSIQSKALRGGWLRDPRGEIETAVVTKVVQNEAKRARRGGMGGGKSSPIDEGGGKSGGNDAGGETQRDLPAGFPSTAPVSHEEAVEAEAERRASVISRHRDEWDEFESVKAKATEVFFDPPMITKSISDGEKTTTFEVADYSQIDAAKRLAEVIMLRQKGERAAFQLDKNINTEKAVDASERDRLIKETFASLREAARLASDRARAAEEAEARTIDVTPKKED